MTGTLDWDDLRRELALPLEELTPYAASRLVLQLGGLARWCLKPEVLRVAAEDEAIPETYRNAWRQLPQLPATHGSCWVLFATGAQNRLPRLRSAFVLPLRWVQGPTHSPRLPAALRQLADRVVASFPKNRRIHGAPWRLQPAWELHAADLAGLPLECQSGWASLAAGLLVAADGGTPDPRVWATGSWDDAEGIRPVDFLEQKLALAGEYGAAVFFVPSVQAEQAAAMAGAIQIGRLHMASRDPDRALADLALRLETPPPPPASAEDDAAFRRCVKYHLKLPRGTARAVEYYSSHLLPTITHRCRRQLQRDYPGWKPTHLVTIVSRNPELVPLIARTLEVAHCLLLYTPDSAGQGGQSAAMRQARRLLEQDGVECTEGVFDDGPPLTQQIPAAIGAFTAGVSPDSMVLDITPGNKWMTWAADHAMPPGSWRLYLRNDTGTTPDQRPRPGSEQLACWTVG